MFGALTVAKRNGSLLACPNTLPLSLVRNEGDLGTTVEGWVLRATALEQMGLKAEAKAQWRAVRALGYPRLWVNDLWVQARSQTP